MLALRNLKHRHKWGLSREMIWVAWCEYRGIPSNARCDQHSKWWEIKCKWSSCFVNEILRKVVSSEGITVIVIGSLMFILSWMCGPLVNAFVRFLSFFFVSVIIVESLICLVFFLLRSSVSIILWYHRCCKVLINHF